MNQQANLTFLTGMNNYGYMPYGGNFIDILFKHLLEKGLAGITVMTVLNLYLYLSLDKIKEFMKWINEKLQEYSKNQIQKYWSYFYGLIDAKKKYFCVLAETNIKYFYILAETKMKQFMTHRYRKHIDDNTKEIISEKITKKNITLSIADKNRFFLVALGNFIIENKIITNEKRIFVENSDKDKHVVYYKLPNRIELNYESIQIEITQNVNMSIIAEKLPNKVIVKNVELKIPTSNESLINITFDEFTKLNYAILGHQLKISGSPKFKFIDWNCEPQNLCCQSDMKAIIACVYYHKNLVFLKKLLRYSQLVVILILMVINIK